MSHQIEIYTKPHCPYCQRAKGLLQIKGVSFIEYDVTDDPVKSREMVQRSKRETVPEIFIDNRLIGGCTELFELDETGELDRLLTD
ncbi:MAG: glutaredoxin 3 [Deltaproteobacteria bacterium]|jgi:glutaredoxin 3|nr:glutaredoxin 3 [Deltaproteobacteria bacterium]MBW2476740.1 glutaredoxin 3 [Deltaproteobacteria bacterium]MBW2505216.1 glutaredoxin 3 [Deltaproteobacteria bacterium]MBW2519480.1 glutaredoxin 3 [Deltaproteobacteria bacterium]